MNNHLSDEDMEKIADMVCEKIEHKLYMNVGYGIVGIAWKGLLMGLIAIAAYGFMGHLGK